MAQCWCCVGEGGVLGVVALAETSKCALEAGATLGAARARVVRCVCGVVVAWW
jgi:hypothetical protein